MAADQISREEATIELKDGDRLVLGLRCYRWLRGQYIYQDRVEWLGFDDSDPERSGEVLKGSRQMSFEVWATLEDSFDIVAYLGDPGLNGPWEEKLTIPLKHQTSQGGWKRWWIGSEQDSNRVRDLRKEYWRAAEAQVCLFQGRGKERVPLRKPDGSIVSTTIRLDYEPEYKTLYEGVLEDMERLTLQGDLTSNFQRYVDFKDLRDRREETAGLELYKRLINVFPKYKDTVLRILRDPNVEYELAVHQNSFSVGEAISHFAARGGSERIETVQDADEVGGKVIPTRFTSHRTSLEVDTPANRFVAHSLHRVREGIQLIKRHLSEEKNAPREFMDEEKLKAFDYKHRRAIERLEEIGQAVDYLTSRQPWPVTPQRNVVSGSSATYYDGRYSRLRELTSLMETLLEFVDASKDAFPFEVQAFHNLYQHWAFIHVVEAMSSIGFEFIDQEGRRTTPFYKNPIQNEVNCRLVSPSQPDFVIEVFYERRYERAKSLERGVRKNENLPIDRLERPYGLENRFPRRTRSRSKKNRPDIVFERHRCGTDFSRPHGSVPEVITLDPTLAHSGTREDAWDEKYEYEDSIRSFVDTDRSGKSKRIVKAAWGISPALRRGQTKFVELFEGGSYQYGFICLRPEEDYINTLPHTLRGMLRYAGWIGD